MREQAVRRLNTQCEVMLVLEESSDVDEALRKIMQVICENLGWRVCAFWRVDTEDDVLRCIDIWHKPTVIMKKFIDVTGSLTFKRKVCLPGRIWESREPAWVLDVQKDKNFLALYELNLQARTLNVFYHDAGR